MEILPSFFVIGQAKCGTTSVCEALRRHPDVFFSDPKEPHYFTFDLPEKTRDWYLTLFRDAGGASAVGEGSTSYTRPDVCDACAEAIRDEVPDARLVYLVRDPIARLESDWKMRVREGRATWNDINRSLADNPEVVELGKYWRNLAGYREYFAEDQLLILFLEDLSAHPEPIMRCLHRHIGVEERASCDAVTPENTARRQRRDGWLLATARRIGLAELARGLLPDRAIRVLRRWGTTPFLYEANWDSALLADMQAMYREASRPLLEFCGRPPDFWSYEARGSRRRG